MLNKEKYAKEIIDIACNGDSVGMRNGILCSCDTINNCQYCDFYNEEILCEKVIKKWANSEYKEKEREIDWSKVPVDIPIVVWRYEDDDKYKRHFAYFKENEIYAWNDGRTSYTSDNNEDAISWEHAEIAEGVNCNEWYKD